MARKSVEYKLSRIIQNKGKAAEKNNYDNRYCSILLYRCRFNTIELGRRIGLGEGESRCGVCPK